MAVTRYYRATPPWADKVAVGINSFTLEGVKVEVEIKREGDELFYKGVFDSEEAFSAYKLLQEQTADSLGFTFSGSTKETFESV
jgi:hypothetical protein